MRHLLFLLFTSFTILLQGQTGRKASYTVYINTVTSSIKAQVLFDNKKQKADEGLVYSWYSANKIIETKGGFDGRLLDGPYTCFYLSDNLKEQGEFSDGLRNSEWRSWYENGKLKEISNWNDGIKTGIYKKFDSRGNLTLEAHYKKGKLHGTEVIYTENKETSRKRYRNGEEIIVKPKKAKPSDSTHIDKKPILPWKKKKTEDLPPVKPENKKPVKSSEHKPLADKKDKKTWKERIQSALKKEKKPTDLVKNEKGSKKKT